MPKNDHRMTKTQTLWKHLVKSHLKQIGKMKLFKMTSSKLYIKKFQQLNSKEIFWLLNYMFVSLLKNKTKYHN
jgi:hypothetical protein